MLYIILCSIALFIAVSAIISVFLYNTQNNDDIKEVTIGTSEKYILPAERAMNPLQFLVSQENDATSWAYALLTNENTDIEVKDIFIAGTAEITVTSKNKNITVPIDAYSLPSTLPVAGQFLVSVDATQTMWSDEFVGVISTAGTIDGSL
jgi:hypothetical protein